MRPREGSLRHAEAESAVQGLWEGADMHCRVSGGSVIFQAVDAVFLEAGNSTRETTARRYSPRSVRALPRVVSAFASSRFERAAASNSSDLLA